MMSCSVCKNKVNNERFLECCQCRHTYHTKCLNIRNDEFSSLTSKHRMKWICPSCSNVSKRERANINTQAQPNQVPVVNESMNMSFENLERSVVQSPTCLNAQLSVSQISTDNNIVTMDKISLLLDQKLNTSLNIFMGNFRSVLKEDVKKLVSAEIDTTVQHLKDDFTTTTNFICDEQSSMKCKIDEQSQAIKSMEAEKLQLQKEINMMNTRLSSMERMTRSHLEIQAVPENRNENPLAMFNNLCRTINVQMDQDKIHSCRRVAKINASSDRPRNILVSLTNPRTRDDILSACHRFNSTNKGDTLNTTHLGLTSQKQKVYVTEHISPECKALHAAARKVAKEKTYKYVWVKYGRVYVRKDDSSSCIHIKNVDTLNNLL